MADDGTPGAVPICAGLLIDRRANGLVLLLGKRAAARRFYPGVWDLIGGHIEAGETPEDALVREIREEIGVTPLAWREVARVVVPAAGPGEAALEFWLYAVTAWSGEPRNLLPEEHDEIGWFGVEEACELDLADASYPELFRRVVRVGRERVTPAPPPPGAHGPGGRGRRVPVPIASLSPTITFPLSTNRADTGPA